ncbi:MULTISPECIES: carbohydrate ABC transporter permease [Deinococcus]|uniref:Carbohydrate ABC transporter permease n=1 Tax=Deinococcus rufus TaxID=2136097 RepID=A0ABV7Z9H7_9DEIO|nr:carbohydrate ABC transporter permease [Deinococcus sp. AB2017081]WQE97311.1 carbohydrate ABC transporter permease [Deinococcus sp. AB2017081]
MTTATPRAARPALRARVIFLMFLGALIFVFWALPFVVVGMNAFKSGEEYFNTTVWTPPRTSHLWENAQAVWRAGVATGFANSLLYGTVSSLIAVVLGAFAAFSITRLRLKFSFGWFMLIYGGTILPAQMLLIPLYKAYLTTGLYDTRAGMILFYVAYAIPFCTFVMRAFFTGVPWEIQEAAKLDGCDNWRLFWRIMMPLAVAPALVLILFQFTAIWNDLLFGLILSKSDHVRPMMTTLAGLSGTYSSITAPTLITAALMSSAPTLLLFVALQRYFIGGLQLTNAGE